MHRTRIIGIDPGLVDTGVVVFDFMPEFKRVEIVATVCIGNDVPIVTRTVLSGVVNDPGHVFIEGYRPRSHYATDERMTLLVKELHRAMPGSKVIDNTGVKKVIAQKLLVALGVWTFTTKTHHQDLRSAALIGLYGMVKDDTLNPVLADFLRDYLDGKKWAVSVR